MAALRRKHCNTLPSCSVCGGGLLETLDELYAPALEVQRKWHTATRNLCPGDVVIVADKNTLRGDYRLALVQDVFPGEDGKVRKVTVKYKSYRTGEKVHEYRGARDTVVSRAVQRLALLVPVD